MNEIAPLLDFFDHGYHSCQSHCDIFGIKERNKLTGKFLCTVLLEVLPVEPSGFFRIETGSRFHHPFEAETLYHLFQRKNLLFSAGVPPQQG